jgi:hypothetical protein
VRFNHIASVIIDVDHSIMSTAAVHRVADWIIRCVIPQPTERQHIGNQINAALIVARMDLASQFAPQGSQAE